MSDTNDAIRTTLIQSMMPDAKAIAYLLVGLILGYALGCI